METLSNYLPFTELNEAAPYLEVVHSLKDIPVKDIERQDWQLEDYTKWRAWAFVVESCRK